MHSLPSRSTTVSTVAGERAIDDRAAKVEADVAAQASVIADLDRRIGALDAIVGQATARGRTKSAMQLVADQRDQRAALAAERLTAARDLAGVKVLRAEVDGERRQMEADLDPLRYLAQLLGAGDERIMRWFILAVALLLDPAAVVLLLAATARGKP